MQSLFFIRRFFTRILSQSVLTDSFGGLLIVKASFTKGGSTHGVTEDCVIAKCHLSILSKLALTAPFQRNLLLSMQICMTKHLRQCYNVKYCVAT